MENVSFQSQRFGRIEAKGTDLIHFDGLPGFPQARRFVLVEHASESLFSWLVCADEPELGFVVTSPWQFFPDYRPELEARDLRRVCPDAGSDVELLVIARVSQGEITLNLAAPLIVNPTSRRGVQAILERGDHSTRARVAPKDSSTGAPPEEDRRG